MNNNKVVNIENLKRPNISITHGILLITVALFLTACNKPEDKQTLPTPDDTIEESLIDEVNKEPVQEIIEEDKNDVETEIDVESTEKVVEETTPEEPIVEMVDFDTWAKQEDNDEVCMVIWNEELGIQDIMPTLSETKKAYEIQEGDKFAIPYKDNIFHVEINDVVYAFENYEYLEVSVPKGEISNVHIAYKNEEGENIILSYGLK